MCWLSRFCIPVPWRHSTGGAIDWTRTGETQPVAPPMILGASRAGSIGDGAASCRPGAHRPAVGHPGGDSQFARRAALRHPQLVVDALMSWPDSDRGVFAISVAADLAGLHPQTLRIYEREGLVQPGRSDGGTRRYSGVDVERLRLIAALTTSGLNLAGVKRVLALETESPR